MERSQIILEYIKVLMWPLVVVLGFIFYSEQFFQIIQSREVEVFGLKIGNQVDEIASSYKAELDALKADMSASGDTSMLKRVESIEANLERELARVKHSAIVEVSPGVTARQQRVKLLEYEGFMAIIDEDLEGAITAFSAASVVWPDYHNVAEIEALLIENRQQLSEVDSSGPWQALFQQLLTEYAWGMPADIRKKMAR